MKNIFLNKFVRTTSSGIAMAGAVALSIFSANTNAATATGTLAVSATVISSCTVSGGPINFGSSIDPIATSVPLDVTGSLTVKCSNTTPYSIAMDGGANVSSGFTRNMKNGTNVVAYQLYSDAARSVVWSNTTAGVGAPVGGTGSGASTPINVYGRVANLTGVVPGAYTDTVTITVTY